MINNKILAAQIKAFRLICSTYNIPQVDMTIVIFLGNETISYNNILRHNFTIKFSSMLHRGYIEQVSDKGKRLRVTNKGLFILDEYYKLLSKLSEAKQTKRALISAIDSI